MELIDTVEFFQNLSLRIRMPIRIIFNDKCNKIFACMFVKHYLIPGIHEIWQIYTAMPKDNSNLTK